MIVQTTLVLLSGAYVPLTMEGNIVVDGVLASCFADCDHDLANLMMTPMHRFSEAMKWILGDDDGFPVFVSTVKQLGILMLPNVQF